MNQPPSTPGLTEGAKANIQPAFTPKVAICLNTSWNVWNFRRTLVKAILGMGISVLVIAPRDKYTDRLINLGCDFRHLQIGGAGTNPFSELKTVWNLRKILNEQRIDILLTFTPKPNVYGAIAAFMTDIKTIANIAGLGAVYTNSRISKNLMNLIYKVALVRASRVFFQNQEDLDYFIRKKLVAENLVERLPGSGVNLNEFSRQPLPETEKGVRFLFAARLLESKGVKYLLEACERLNKSRPGEFFLTILGAKARSGSDSIPQKEIESWNKISYIRYYDHVDDVRAHIYASHCVVLPTFYGEGVPRILLEALSCGRIVITTSRPGCQETAQNNNGFLVPPRDSKALFDAMLSCLDEKEETLTTMAKNSRVLAEQKFDEQIVVKRYLESIRSMTFTTA